MSGCGIITQNLLSVAHFCNFALCNHAANESNLHPDMLSVKLSISKPAAGNCQSECMQMQMIPCSAMAERDSSSFIRADGCKFH
jgi:hypothetical protein